MTSALSESGEKNITDEKVQIKNILVPIDGSNCSMKAAGYVIEIAKLQKAMIHVIHVIEPLPYGVDYLGPTFDEYSKDIIKQSESWFNQIIKMTESKDIDNIKTDILTDTRSTISTIINYAHSNSIDLIIIGTKGKTGLARFLLGSIANGVVKHAHCPVLLIK